MKTKRDQSQIDKLKEDIARVSRLMANPNWPESTAVMLDKRRQKYHTALKILSK